MPYLPQDLVVFNRAQFVLFFYQQSYLQISQKDLLHMVNSISINSDMTKLIFISNSETSELDLSGDGVILRMSGGDIGADLAGTSYSGSGVVENTENAQWTVFFNDAVKKVFFIGIEDIDTSIINNSHQFDVDGKDINIKRSGSSLITIYTT